MPELPRLIASEAEWLLQQHGFAWISSKRHGRLYQKGSTRVVLPIHVAGALHPKIVRQVFVSLKLEPEPSSKP